MYCCFSSIIILKSNNKLDFFNVITDKLNTLLFVQDFLFLFNELVTMKRNLNENII